jgi:outer membrane lipoprotein carrier protein
VQEAHIASLDKRDVSRGRVVMQRPGRMRWEYIEPEARVIVLDQETLRVYTPSEAQLQIVSAAGGAFSPTALGFLLGEGDLRADFSSETLEVAGRDEVGLKLRPRGDAAFEHLEMWLEPESHQLRESVVVDVFGNRTSVRFDEITENAGVDDGAFEIDVPEGTEVIDLR